MIHLIRRHREVLIHLIRKHRDMNIQTPSAQRNQERDEWQSIYRPIAQHIVYGTIHFLPIAFHGGYFAAEPEGDWLYLRIFGIIAMLTGVIPSIMALVFSHKIDSAWLCRLVKISLVGLIIGVSLAVISLANFNTHRM